MAHEEKRGAKELEAFRALMQRKLNQNSHKPNWKHDSLDMLLFLLDAEVVELKKALLEWKHGESEEHEAALAVALECADVANFAMFIADAVDGLKPSVQEENDDHLKKVLAHEFVIEEGEHRITVAGFLKLLLETLWEQEEGFSGKRPLGNSGWKNDMATEFIRAGFISGSLDEYGYITSYDKDSFDRLIIDAIRMLRG